MNNSEAPFRFIFLRRTVGMLLTIVRLTGSVATGIALNWLINYLRMR